MAEKIAVISEVLQRDRSPEEASLAVPDDVLDIVNEDITIMSRKVQRKC